LRQDQAHAIDRKPPSLSNWYSPRLSAAGAPLTRRHSRAGSTRSPLSSSCTPLSTRLSGTREKAMRRNFALRPDNSTRLRSRRSPECSSISTGASPTTTLQRARSSLASTLTVPLNPVPACQSKIRASIGDSRSLASTR